MKAKGIQADLVWFPGAQHDLVGSDLDQANQLSEAWIRKALRMQFATSFRYCKFWRWEPGGTWEFNAVLTANFTARLRRQ